MGWDDPDVYHDPEKFGLTIVGDIGDPEACYSFNDLIVWQHDDGQLYWATDAGCSCPSPFETYTSLESLGDPITSENWSAFEEGVKEHCGGQYAYGEQLSEHFQAAKGELLANVAKLLWEQEKKS